MAKFHGTGKIQMNKVRGNVYFFILMKLKDLHHYSHAMLIKWLQVAEMITLYSISDIRFELLTLFEK